MNKLNFHPGFGPWECPTETFVDEEGRPVKCYDLNTGTWRTEIEGHGELRSIDLRSDFLSRHPSIQPLRSEGWPRPRQCLIDDADAISFSQCLKILAQQWSATPAEIALWVGMASDGKGDLHVFSSHHEIYFEALGGRFWRRGPGVEGCNRPCIPFGSAGEPDDCTIEERLSHYAFSRTEVEGFDPARNEDDPTAKIEYYVDGTVLGGGWFNPSGRFLSYTQAVQFLSRYEPDKQILWSIIAREFRRGALNAFKPFAGWLNLEKNSSPLEGFYFEGQILGLAKEEFGAEITRWDAATTFRISPDASARDNRDVPEETDAPGVVSDSTLQPSDALAEFREMQDLQAKELTLRFLAGNLVEVRARSLSRRVSCGELNLLSKVTGELTNGAALLLAMSKGLSIPRGGKGNGKAISRLRRLFADKLNICKDPFAKDWTPHFRIEDKRSARDEKAKREARRVPFNEQVGGSAAYPFGPPDKNDPAAPYLT
ncbi:MAG: hypothetical protein U9Q81_01120 [Pseudomonadota bacterium]|nr:hypothetical protein [Pseudomonadota bacterium]